MKKISAIVALICLFASIQAQLSYDNQYQYSGNNNNNNNQRNPNTANNQRQPNNNNNNNGFRPADGIKPAPGSNPIYPYRIGPMIPNNRNQQNSQVNSASANNNLGDNQPFVPIDEAVLLRLQLVAYSNPNRQLPFGRICYDSKPAPPSLDGSGGGSSGGGSSGGGSTQSASSDLDCQLTFITNIVTAGDPVHSLATQEWMQLTARETSISLNQVGTWKQAHSFALKRKPVIVSVTVIHTGVMRYQNGSWPYKNARYTAVMDTFTVNMTNILPDFNQGMSHTNQEVTGDLIQTRLRLSFGFMCVNHMKGPNCDLYCNTTSQFGGTICRSKYTGKQSICQYNTGNQVSDCMECGLGVFVDTKNSRLVCETVSNNEMKPIIVQNHTASIVLGILVGLLALALILVIGAVIFMSRKKKKETSAPPPTGTGHHQQHQQPSSWASRFPMRRPSQEPAKQPLRSEWDNRPHLAAMESTTGSQFGDSDSFTQQQAAALRREAAV